MTQKMSVLLLGSCQTLTRCRRIIKTAQVPAAVVRPNTGYIQIAGHQLPGTDTHRNNYGNGLYSFVSRYK